MKLFKIKKSKIDKNGLYANRDIRKGTRILEYKGKIISYERLLGNTQDVLLEILYHLKQFGMNIDINLDDIKNFVTNNRIEKNIDDNLSNNEKKFLEKNLN